MPKASAIEVELDDGGYIARSGKPLPQFSGLSGSAHSFLLGSRNYKRSYGGKEATSTPAGKQTKCKAEESNDADRLKIAQHEPVAEPAHDILECGTNSRKQTVTLTGTIKRGRKQDKVVEVQFEIPEKDLKRLNAKLHEEEDDKAVCTPGLNRGPHIILFTILFSPFAFLGSIFTTFYISTLCWYNIYINVSEEHTIWHKIFFCPLLLIAYPVLITTATLSLSVVAAVKQVSWCLSRWCSELQDYDKGFFVWLCNAMNIPHCAPYEVVILDERPLAENVALEQQSETAESSVQALV